jgi:hypothetical protein
MSNLPVTSDYERDTGHLNTLSIFWYIIAVIDLLGGCVFGAWIGFALLMGAGIASSGRSDDASAGAAIGGMFTCVGLIPLVLLWICSFLSFTVARSLPKRRNRTLCFILAVIVCLWFPLGTVLGVFTLIVLSRPSVKNATT